MSRTTADVRYRTVILCLAFVSGFVIMSIELLGGRILAPWFGSSIHVWGSIITIFMLSLSIGYLLGGRLSTRHPNLRTYGVFFALGAITLAPLILFGESMMQWLFDRVTDPRYGSLLVSALLFFLPTSILGMIAPYSVRLLVENEQHSGRVAGLLYFVSTLGSALGTLGTSFYLVLWFDMNVILVTLAGALLASAVVAMLAHRLLERTA